MKSINTKAFAAAAVMLTLGSFARANEIVIYKHTDSRPWIQYTCIRPTSTDSANPAVPQTNIVGKYTQTEYWIYDATSSTIRKISYWSQPILGGKPSKRYEVGAPDIVLGKASVNAGAASDTNVEMFVRTNKTGISKHTLVEAIDQEEITDLDGNLVNDLQRVTQRQLLIGDAKLLKVSSTNPVLSFARIASKLTGDWRYGNDTQLLEGTVTQIYRRQIYETGKPTLTLDLPKTKLANQGASPLTAYYGGTPANVATIDYAMILLENELYKLGYDKD